MTHHDVPDRDLVAWFADDATRRAPARLLDAVIADTGRRSQQPGWLVALRGEAMGAGPVGTARARQVAALIVLVALIVAAAAFIAGQQKQHAGPLAYISNGDVYLANEDGSGTRLVLRQDGVAFSTVAWSPTGLLALDGDVGVVVLDVSTGRTSVVGGHSPVWSADGKRLAVLVQVPGPKPLDYGTPSLRILDAMSLSTDALYPFSAIGSLSWSPNGRWIAATGGAGAKSVVRIDVTTGEEIQIDGPSGHLDSDKEVTWSPDSLHVAFIRYRDVQPQDGSCSDNLACRVDVIVADADGSYAHVANGVAQSADQPSWSPDGQWIAFRNVSGNSLGPLGLQVMRADGTGERSLVSGKVRGYAWSPDSTHLLYAAADLSSQPAAVWRVSLAGESQSLGFSIDRGDTPFEATGLAVALRATGPGSRSISMPSLEATERPPTPEVVAPAPASPADPSAIWPTIVTDEQYGCEPVLINTETGTTTEVAKLCDPAADPPSYVLGSAWSPTGSAYAVLRVKTLLQSTLTIVGRDGATQFELAVPLPTGGWAWAPDGTRLAFIVNGDVWVFEEGSSGAWSVLKDTVGDVIDVAWSPDGQALAMFRSDGNLQIGGRDGGDLRAMGTYPLPVAWAPDGWPFAFVRDGDVWLVDSNGSAPRNISHLPLGGAIGASWSPDGTRIVVVTGSGLLVVDPDGSHQRWLDLGVAQPLAAVWAPRSDRFAVQEAGSVLIVNGDGSPSILVDREGSPSWSPDGRFLLIRDSSYGRLAVANADGSGLRELNVVTQSDLGAAIWVR